MSSTIKTVAIAGATGTVGKQTVQEFVAAGFEVIALTRAGSSSSSSFPSGVTVKAIDYSSKASLVDALKGAQGLVSVLGAEALGLQSTLVDAAAEAGIIRFLPSEFGSDTAHPKASKLPVFGPKIETMEKIKQKSAENPSFTWTALCTGPFLDYCLQHGLFADLKNRKATFVNGGDKLFSTTPIPQAAKAMTGVFKNLDATKNQFVYVESTHITQKKIVQIAEKLTGDKFTTEDVKSDDLEAAAYEELKQPQPSPVWVFNMLKVAILSGEHGTYFGDKVTNDAVGLKTFSEKDTEEEIKKWL